MSRLKRVCVVLGYIVVLPALTGLAARSPSRPSAAAAYTKRVSAIDSCDKLASADRPPLADPLLMNLVRKDIAGTLLSGDEFLTKTANEERHGRIIVAALGGTDTVITRFVFQPFQVKYNADEGIMRMWDVSGPGPGKAPWRRESNIRIGKKWITRARENRQNAYGAKSIVEIANITMVSIGYDSTRVATKYRSGDNIFGLQFPMSPSDAQAFKASPSVLFMGKLTAPYVHQSSIFPEATVDLPLEGVITDLAFTVDAQCMLLMAGDRVLGDFQAMVRR